MTCEIRDGISCRTPPPVSHHFLLKLNSNRIIPHHHWREKEREAHTDSDTHTHSHRVLLSHRCGKYMGLPSPLRVEYIYEVSGLHGFETFLLQAETMNIYFTLFPAHLYYSSNLSCQRYMDTSTMSITS